MEQLTAGRELDALVAEKVMDEPEPIYVPDWDRVTLVTFNGGVLWSEKGNWYWICDGDKNDGVFCYPRPFSTDIAAAWAVVEKLAEQGWIISVCWGNGANHKPYASIQMATDLFLDLVTRPPMEMDAKAHTVPLAICLASLRAVGVEYGTS